MTSQAVRRVAIYPRQSKKCPPMAGFYDAMSLAGRFCSLIPGLGVKLSNNHPCRAHCSLRGRGDPSA